MNKNGFIKIALVVLIVVLLGVVGYFTLIKKPTSPITETNQQQATPPVTPTTQVAMANWKTYQNDEFGFEFKYPAELKAVSSKPNEEQKKLDRGEMISGTVPPSYDTITLAGFKGYLSMGSACDTRWMDSVSDGPTLVNKNGVSVLEVQVIASGPKESVSNGCYYFKSSGGDLVVFNVSGFEQKSDYLNVFHLVGDKILTTLSLTK